jgi:uncharacterized protein with GYD domain
LRPLTIRDQYANCATRLNIPNRTTTSNLPEHGHIPHFRQQLDSSVAAAYCFNSWEDIRMPHYVTLLRYTQQGAAKIKESPARLDAAKKAAEAAGGKIHAWYLTMGKYDAVLVSEFPADEAAARFMLSTGALGNVTTHTLKAFSEAEYRKIVGSLP